MNISRKEQVRLQNNLKQVLSLANPEGEVWVLYYNRLQESYRKEDKSAKAVEVIFQNIQLWFNDLVEAGYVKGIESLSSINISGYKDDSNIKTPYSAIYKFQLTHEGRDFKGLTLSVFPFYGHKVGVFFLHFIKDHIIGKVIFYFLGLVSAYFFNRL